MKSREDKEKDREAREWLMRPLYNIMLLSLVILELFGKQIDEGIRNAFHIVLWIVLGCVVLLNIIAFFIKRNNKSEAVLEGTQSDGMEENP
jgi:hypothetical protein